MKVRAPRYSLPIPILFRLEGEAVWELGTVENMSGSGVLFHAKSWLAADTALEVRLPVPCGADRIPILLSCRADVVRARWADGLNTCIAARYSSFEFIQAVSASSNLSSANRSAQAG